MIFENEKWHNVSLPKSIKKENVNLVIVYCTQHKHPLVEIVILTVTPFTCHDLEQRTNCNNTSINMSNTMSII